MITIRDKKDCCGCHACASICAKHCITMQPDEEGFLYPIVNKDACTDCGLCEKICPVINQREPRKPLKVYAAKNKNEEIRRQSSSGGIFTLLAEKVIEEGGVVFGARFNENWDVVHAWTDTIEGIAAFRGSKYVQSTIGDTYRKAKDFLKQGRKVLFSGTPCQIAGLKKYLRREYDNLLTIDVVCHGVPSPKVWREYLRGINNSQFPISYVNLRSKNRGWSQYSYLIKASDNVLYDDFAYKSPFSQGFSLNLTLRPSCYDCPARSGSSNADITLADCWGIQKLENIKNDDKGYSSVILWRDAMSVSSSLAEFITCELEYDFVIENNPSIVISPVKPYCRKKFWSIYKKRGVEAVTIVANKLKGNYFFRAYNKIRTLLNL